MKDNDTQAMGKCSVLGAVLHGAEALPVAVEVSLEDAPPSVLVVGMADASVQESRERVRSALKASGFAVPPCRIVVSLEPGYLRKTGTGLDLPMAVGILAASG